MPRCAPSPWVSRPSFTVSTGWCVWGVVRLPAGERVIWNKEKPCRRRCIPLDTMICRRCRRLGWTTMIPLLLRLSEVVQVVCLARLYRCLAPFAMSCVVCNFTPGMNHADRSDDSICACGPSWLLVLLARRPMYATVEQSGHSGRR